MQTALQELISDILSGKIADTLANQQYYLDKEKKQFIDFLLWYDKDLRMGDTAEIIINNYYSQTFEQTPDF